MKCPICTEHDLAMSERQGIEIDYCPNCRGIWLDRGELDKLIDKAISNEMRSSNKQQQTPQREFYSDYPKYRKKHWLSDLFD